MKKRIMNSVKINFQKDFAKYIFRRMTEEKGVSLINSLPLLEKEKQILIKVDVLKIPQKKIAYDESCDVKTISRRYNKALEMSAPALTSYISGLLNAP